MADDLSSGASVLTNCPWCSAPLPSPDAVTCSACGATIHGDEPGALPGVTALDAEAVSRASRASRSSGGILSSWLGTGEADVRAAKDAPGSLAPPDNAVKREMLRLEIAAEMADLQAEAESIIADAVVEGRALPGEALIPSEASEAGVESPSNGASPDTTGSPQPQPAGVADAAEPREPAAG
ncbi:MAG: hypothetical protein ACJ761_02740 [Chloroflexota bacterium]